MFNTPEIDQYSLKWGKRAALFGDKDVLPMWVADMDYPAPQVLIDAMTERAVNGIYGYSFLLEKGYDAFIKWTAEHHNWQIQKDWMRITPGVVPALHFAVRAFSNPGDSIIVQTPVYYPFFEAIENNDRQIIRNPLLLRNNRYTMDLTQLRQSIRKNTKCLILCNPHNPGGRVWTLSELKELASICAEHGIVILSDEIHCDLVFDGKKHLPLAAAIPELRNYMAAFYGPGKTFNCAGLQIGTAVIPGKKMRQLFDSVTAEAGMDMNNCFSVSGFTSVYNGGEEWLKAAKEKLQKHRDIIVSFFRKEIPRLQVIEPEGTYLLWVDCRSLGLTS